VLAGRISIPLPEQTLQATPVLSNCPDCNASLAVLRIIPGRAGAEYWTMRCPRCGGIHLDIVNPSRSLAME
jgi:Zn finger protein HypA/HybF involved in hydrogenase expression